MSGLKLFSEFKWGGQLLKNRIALAPLTRGRSGPERIPNDWNIKYYTDRASAGLIIAEGTHPSKQGVGWVDSPGIWNKEQAEGWRRVTDAVHAAGGTIVLQFWHQGRTCHPDFYGIEPVAPSAIAAKSELHLPNGTKTACVVPRELTKEDIAEVVRDFENAARLSKEAGFDGVEIHCANGYLLNTFLDSSTNIRTDEYGGSVENRFRIVSEIIDVVNQHFSKEQIGVRISPNGGYNDMGAPDSVETYVEVSRLLAQKEIGYLHVMDGLAFGYHERAPVLQLAQIREVFPGTIIANCGYTKETAEAQLQSGNADIISFGRPYLANPDLVERFRNNWPLAELDFKLWFSHGAEGYIDQAFYQPPAEDEAKEQEGKL